MTTHDFGRVIPALVTPLRADGEVDAKRAASLARKLVDEGCDAVLVGGTTAESPTLSPDERVRVLASVLEAVGDRVFVWAGTGTNDTATSVALSRRARSEGAHGLMLVAPYYNKPPQSGLIRHFGTVAEAVDLPIMIYNIPGRTSVNVAPETIARLRAGWRNIQAVKEASGNLDQVSEIRRLAPDLAVYAGDDSLTLPILALGGRGVVSVAAHVAAGPIRDMVDAFARGDVQRAEAIHRALFPLFKALFVTTNPIPVKYALKLTGFDVGGYRPPLVDPSAHEMEAVAKALAEVASALGIALSGERG
ncbi:MAG: 4-hydroxy-tetrahydrodipicolinate synthase [Clostridia bacterium]|nr:4-hydroxy-tetrahydrodipicolinate synthase [Clostridia bacterium]